MVFIRNLVGGLLAELEDNIDHDRFKRLLHYSRRLASFKNRAKLVCLFCKYSFFVLTADFGQVEEALEEVLGQGQFPLTMQCITQSRSLYIYRR